MESEGLGSMLGTTLLSLVAVVALAWVVLWLLKKSSLVQGQAQAVKVISSVAVGAKERVVQVQYKDKELLLGVTANAIHVLAESSAKAETTGSGSPQPTSDQGNH